MLAQPKPDAAVTELYRRLGVRIRESFDPIGRSQVLELPARADVPESFRALRRSNLVVHAEPDCLVHLQAEPNDFR
ncbi:MAG: hypothetical protein HY302_08730 [Opitutae bacterium]|nr:hypothetical protein [Opitutae bacterium]